jgi:hypothetical protein
MAPLSAFAESINLLRLPEKNQQSSKTSEKPRGRKLSLGTDDDGNVMVKYKKVCLTFIYGPESGANEQKDRVGLVPPLKEAAGIGEIKCRVGFVF